MPTPDDRETLTAAATLTPERFARVRAIFEAALERRPNERRAYVEGACRGDRALFEVIDGMLLAEGKQGDLLDRPPSSAPEEGRFPAGTVLAGRYRILGLLGRGGMGEVYKAFDLILNQIVALKFLTPARVSEAALTRFRNEVRIARQVSHPNVCRVYDLGMVEGLHFLSMEFIDGEDLASLLRRIGRLPQDKAVEFTRKICAGLAAAHDRGVLHRDLKPANVMIDGRGQPRITDFGLAALAQEIPLSDLRSGTPAYMSPEQKAGKEVTTRSDIFSLGLVLHEMFTGQQRKDSHSAPSDFVKELDPTIERLILRCLDEEPKRRPSSAYGVAMALPGADPIAAALAAGETPSPEMVAASQEQEGLSPRAAVIVYAVLIAALLGGAAFSAEMGFLSRAQLALPPDAMADRALLLVRSLGYTSEPDSTSFGYRCCTEPPNSLVEGLSSDERKKFFGSHQPPIITFSYQQQSLSPDSVAAGMIRVELDGKARLTGLEVHTQPPAPPVALAGWDNLFQAAGLDIARFTPTQPRAAPDLALDTQAAWIGTYSDDRPERVILEAASWKGRPTYFRVSNDLLQPSVVARVIYFVRTPLALILIFGGLLLGATLAAWRNLRAGRGDKRGAYVVLGASALCVAGILLLVPNGIALQRELLMLEPLMCSTLYIATEPFVRRNWPNALISWSRLCEGRVRNSLVASHALIGVMGGVIYAALAPVLVELASHAKGRALSANVVGINYLGGLGNTLASLSSSALEGLTISLFFLLAVVLLRSVIRKVWLADLIAVLIVVAPVTFNAGVWVGAFLAPCWLTYMWLLRRFGFLAFITVFAVTPTMIYFPLVVSGWIAPQSLTIYSIPLIIATWALWVILNAQRGPSLDSASQLS